MTSGRIHIIDTLRGLAAVAVAVFHFNQIRVRDGSLYDRANAWGWLGVAVFFVLSGYCVQTAADREHTPRVFLLRRFARLYPAYLFSVVAVVLFCVARKYTSGLNDFITLPTSVGGWLATLTLTTTPVTDHPTINWVYWSLSYEVSFYLVLAIGLAWPRARFAVPLALSVAAFFPPAQRAVFFLGQWGFFVLGVALAFYARGEKRSALVLALFGVVLSFHQHLQREGLVAIATAGLILFSPKLEALGGRAIAPLAKLGEISYGLYLIHVPIGVWVILRFTDAHGWRSGNFLLRLACDGVALGASLFAAAAIYRWIEQPAIAWGRRITATPAAR